MMIHRRAGVLPFVAAGLCAIGAIQAHDLFDVRVAGNIAADAEVASIEYAAEQNPARTVSEVAVCGFPHARG